MKNFITLVGYGLAMSIGFKFGDWLWENKLEDTVENIRDGFKK